MRCLVTVWPSSPAFSPPLLLLCPFLQPSTYPSPASAPSAGFPSLGLRVWEEALLPGPHPHQRATATRLARTQRSQASNCLLGPDRGLDQKVKPQVSWPGVAVLGEKEVHPGGLHGRLESEREENSPQLRTVLSL